jgi:hypothetical protein
MKAVKPCSLFGRKGVVNRVLFNHCLTFLYCETLTSMYAPFKLFSCIFGYIAVFRIRYNFRLGNKINCYGTIPSLSVAHNFYYLFLMREF